MRYWAAMTGAGSRPGAQRGTRAGAIPDLDARNVDATIAWNTAVLATCLALGWAVVQVQAALGAITSAALTADPAMAGVGPAVFLAAVAIGALVLGRLMDRAGRAPVISLGFVLGAVGGTAVFAAVTLAIPALFFAGMALLGLMSGTVGLARAGAVDMYPPLRRGRGIGLMLLGAAAGTVLGPLLLAPLLGGQAADQASLSAPWLVAVALMAFGAGIVLAIRVDPIAIGRWWRTAEPATGLAAPDPREARLHSLAVAAPDPRVDARPPRRRSLVAIYGSAGTRTALASMIVAQAVMTTSMALIPVVMKGHGHDLGTVSTTISAHLLGMFVLAPFMGAIIDRVGRRRSLLGGLFVLAAAVLGLQLGTGSATLLPSMFMVGVGWNIAYVAGTALIGDETSAEERGAALGAADFLSVGAAAAGSLIAGAVLPGVGLQVIAGAAALAAILPALLLTRIGRTTAPPRAVAAARGEGR